MLMLEKPACVENREHTFVPASEIGNMPGNVLLDASSVCTSCGVTRFQQEGRETMYVFPEKGGELAILCKYWNIRLHALNNGKLGCTHAFEFTTPNGAAALIRLRIQDHTIVMFLVDGSTFLATHRFSKLIPWEDLLKKLYREYVSQDAGGAALGTLHS